MKKLLLTFSFLIFNGILVNGQTTATDFTATDCSSVSRNLFTQLNAGKIVVLVWAMPCGACISDSKAGYDAAQSFATSHPGKVLYWLVDDAGNTSCSSLSSWASTNSIGPVSSTVAFFGNSGNAINEANYGGAGMPHVVVMGGASHSIYFNVKNGSGNLTPITNAINSAIAGTTGIAPISNSNNEVKLFPNPAKDRISVSYNLGNTATVSIEVYDIVGKNVKTTKLGEQSSGQHSFDFNFENKLANGMYFLKLNTNNASQTIKFTIAD